MVKNCAPCLNKILLFFKKKFPYLEWIFSLSSLKWVNSWGPSMLGTKHWGFRVTTLPKHLLLLVRRAEMGIACLGPLRDVSQIILVFFIINYFQYYFELFHIRSNRINFYLLIKTLNYNWTISKFEKFWICLILRKCS